MYNKNALTIIIVLFYIYKDFLIFFIIYICNVKAKFFFEGGRVGIICTIQRKLLIGIRWRDRQILVTTLRSTFKSVILSPK